MYALRFGNGQYWDSVKEWFSNKPVTLFKTKKEAQKLLKTRLKDFHGYVVPVGKPEKMKYWVIGEGGGAFYLSREGKLDYFWKARLFNSKETAEKHIKDVKQRVNSVWAEEAWYYGDNSEIVYVESYAQLRERGEEIEERDRRRKENDKKWKRIKEGVR